MKTYTTIQGLWISEISVKGILCICEANKRSEARRGALDMAKRRANK